MILIQSWIHQMKKVNRNGRRLFKILLDLLFIMTSYALCYLIRFDLKLPSEYASLMLKTMPMVIVISEGFLLVFHRYDEFWVYWSLAELKKMLLSHTLSVAALLALDAALPSIRIPLSIYFMYWFVASLALMGFRAICHWILIQKWPAPAAKKRLLVIGAGSAGEMLVHQVANEPSLPFRIVGLIDDDPQKTNRSIHGIRVLGDSDSLASIAQSKRAEEIVIAIPSLTSSQMFRIVKKCEYARIPFRTAPGPSEIIDGRVSFNRLRPVRINDLLGREQQPIDLARVRKLLSGKTVLVTGAAGSIGSELCVQILRFSPEMVIAIDRDENGIFYLSSRLADLGNARCIVANAANRMKMESFFRQYQPSIVFHAAAYKHVPCMEAVPDEAVLNNLESTITITDCAAEFGVEKFVQISTDKAVNPTNVMGASKRLCELIVQNHTRQGRRGFLSVRFGNVIGSQGSVFTVFEQQIREGKPLTVTHPDMKRFFMTIEEACKLVLEAAAIGGGGCIFGLEMGNSIRIVDLAKNIAELAGSKPEDVVIRFTGIRPGEKLDEELWYPFEKPMVSDNPKIYYVKSANSVTGNFRHLIQNVLDFARKMEIESMIHEIQNVIPEYRPIRESNSS